MYRGVQLQMPLTRAKVGFDGANDLRKIVRHFPVLANACRGATPVEDVGRMEAERRRSSEKMRGGRDMACCSLEPIVRKQGVYSFMGRERAIWRRAHS